MKRRNIGNLSIRFSVKKNRRKTTLMVRPHEQNPEKRIVKIGLEN